MSSCARLTLPAFMKKLNVGLIQLKVGKNKVENIKRASSKILDAVSQKRLDLVALPECFNSPYGVDFFNDYAETIPDGETCKMLSDEAKKHDIYIVGGTIPEKSEGKLYNTCTVWNPQGELIGKYRKMHLFDINIPGKITFMESKVLSAGNDILTFEAKKIKIGIGICYDLRFNQLATIYRQKGCEMLIYPGAFNMTTGPLHWEVLQRGRAIDNQVFVCSISPARGEKGYIAWGHSQITSPWGKVKNLEGEEGILIDELDFNECETFREQLPLFHQRRDDIYETRLLPVKDKECVNY